MGSTTLRSDAEVLDAHFIQSVSLTDLTDSSPKKDFTFSDIVIPIKFLEKLMVEPTGDSSFGVFFSFMLIKP